MQGGERVSNLRGQSENLLFGKHIRHCARNWGQRLSKIGGIAALIVCIIVGEDTANECHPM